jgi:hypothetical protein
LTLRPVLERAKVMFSPHAKIIAGRPGLALIASFILLAPAASFANPRAAGPFAGLGGNWSGGGVITMSNGASERIRCTAANMVSASGAEMRQTLRCASASYRLDISSSTVSQGGFLSGTWAETTRGISGNLSGRASSGGLSANVIGGNFTARLNVRLQGGRQVVSIKPQAGTDVAAVSVSLRRG